MSETKPKKKHYVRNTILILIVLILAVTAMSRAKQEDNQKYLGHGFDYMNGYSSTDFTGYHVYDSEKLYKLDHEASFVIENEEDMPILDGAEACYPVYSALALSAYRNIDQIEKEWHDRAEEWWNARELDEYDEESADAYFYNGHIVTFTNSSDAYYRLVNRKVDMVFAARPSLAQKQYASECNEEIMTTPIGKEAFVFFTEADNPVDNLTSDQIRAIYHGDITNWKEVGGKNRKIVAFQRPENSGSQVMMNYFMGDVPLADPKKVEIMNIGPMGGIVERVAEYNDEAGALGYTFRYFLEGMNQEKNVKMLAVDGVYPSVENIRSGKYPVIASLVCATLASNEKQSVKDMMNYILSDDGQEIIEKTGYAPLSDRNVTPTKENELIYDEIEFVLTNINMNAHLFIYGDLEGQMPHRFILKTDLDEIKGSVNQQYSDGKLIDDQYYIFSDDGSYEQDLIYDRETKTITFINETYKRDDLIVPDPGAIFELVTE
ncbi:MAG: substrate-binding domain-containing protein [Erysipelotrichaceae bacterium]|nr:substrate-binding domain-containing protein [Erysipelotrichaceae bacterium]